MRNPALDRLSRDELSLGVILRQARSAEIARVMRTAGFDWLFFDLEHNSMSIETVGEMCSAALGSGIAPIVRVPERQFSMATRALDGGAQGIVMPHVDTPEQAREVVRQLRYPPLGRRSISSMQVHLDFRSVPVAELVANLEPDTLIAVMLETREAIGNCEAIAAVDGIDVVMVGGNDLSADLGVPGQVAHPDVREAFRRVALACRRHGRHVGLGGVRKEEELKPLFDQGYRFILAANDVAMLVEAGARRSATLRALAGGPAG